MEQLAFAAKVLPQEPLPLIMVKLLALAPEIAMLATFRFASPVFDSVNVCGALVAPAVWMVNEKKFDGVRTAYGAGGG
jgi:methenyltetrahydromethanopterin cyclohydrolase